MLTLVICNAGRMYQGEKLTTMLSLPATDDQLQQAAQAIELPDFQPGTYHYTDWSFDKELCSINDFMASTSEIYKLNLLAYKLEAFSEEQRNQYIALFTDRIKVSDNDLINTAYELENGLYKIWPAFDLEDVGKYHVENEVPSLTPEVTDNIDYESVGYDLQANEGGKLTGVGYIRNFNEKFEPFYDGTNLFELLSKAREVLELDTPKIDGCSL